MFQFTQLPSDSSSKTSAYEIKDIPPKNWLMKYYHKDRKKIVVITKFTDNPLPLSFWFEVAKEPSKIDDPELFKK